MPKLLMTASKTNYDLFLNSEWYEGPSLDDLSVREKCLHIAKHHIDDFCGFMCMNSGYALFIRWCASEQARHDLYEFPTLRTIKTDNFEAYLSINSLEESDAYLSDLIVAFVCNSFPTGLDFSELAIAGFGCSHARSRWEFRRVDCWGFLSGWMEKKDDPTKITKLMMDNTDEKDQLEIRVKMANNDVTIVPEVVRSDSSEPFNTIVVKYPSSKIWTPVLENHMRMKMYQSRDSYDMEPSTCTYRTRLPKPFLPIKTRRSDIQANEKSNARNALKIPEILMFVLQYTDYDLNALNALLPLFRLTSNMTEKTFNHLMMMSFCDRGTFAYMRITEESFVNYVRDMLKVPNIESDTVTVPFGRYENSEDVVWPSDMFPSEEYFRERVRGHIKYCMDNLDHNFNVDEHVLSRKIPMIFCGNADLDEDISWEKDYDYRLSHLLKCEIPGFGESCLKTVVQVAVNDRDDYDIMLAETLWGKYYIVSEEFVIPGKLHKLFRPHKKGLYCTRRIWPERIRYVVENNIRPVSEFVGPTLSEFMSCSPSAHIEMRRHIDVIGLLKSASQEEKLRFISDIYGATDELALMRIFPDIESFKKEAMTIWDPSILAIPCGREEYVTRRKFMQYIGYPKSKLRGYRT